jgi:hypothetical protein
MNVGFSEKRATFVNFVNTVAHSECTSNYSHLMVLSEILCEDLPGKNALERSDGRFNKVRLD